MNQVASFLSKLFETHGVESVGQGNWIAFPGRSMRANAEVVDEKEHRVGVVVQLDVRLELSPGRVLVESCGGVGAKRDEAISDAVRGFVANSFHILLAAFFRPDDPQVSRDEWAVDGRTHRATVGSMCVKGMPPVPAEQLADPYNALMQRLKTKDLVPGVHWVRLYYAHAGGKSVACEALLDNDVWGEVQGDVAAVDWPAGEPFYSVRGFLVIQVERGRPASPASAVRWLAQVVAPRQQFANDEVYADMAEAGVPDDIALLAYNFTQVAWGRVLLAELGVQFGADYACFNEAGDVVETGPIAGQPYFAAAMALAPQYVGSPGFHQLAMTSADVNVVNDALHAGAKPKDLVLSAAGVFLEPPSPDGMEKIRTWLASRAGATATPATRPATELAKVDPSAIDQPTAAIAVRPWWRFW